MTDNYQDTFLFCKIKTHLQFLKFIVFQTDTQKKSRI
jgi:hypothetical protein